MLSNNKGEKKSIHNRGIDLKNITVKVFGGLRDVFGVRQLEVGLEDNATLRDLLEILFQKFGDKVRVKIYDEETQQLKKFFNIFVNGHDIKFIKNLETFLNGGDAVAIFPPIAGG